LLFQSFLSQTPTKYKPLLLQITNLNSKLESITLSDSNHAFKFHLPQRVFEIFKASINKYIMTSKLIGSFVMVTLWQIHYRLMQNSHKLDIILEINQMEYLDGLNNEYVEGNQKQRSYFVIDVKNYEKLPLDDPLKKNLLKLKKSLIRKEFKQDQENIEKSMEEWTQMILRKSEERLEEIVIIDDDINENLIKSNEKDMEKENNKLFSKNPMKKQVLGLENKVKMIYDQGVLEEIYGKNSQETSQISELESLNPDNLEETMGELISNENQENFEILEKNIKKRKDSDLSFNKNSLKKLKISEEKKEDASLLNNNREMEINEEKIPCGSFTLNQIMKYKSIFLNKN